jgi:hypothetical protein
MMKTRYSAVALLVCWSSTVLGQQSAAIQFDVDGGADAKPISRYIYGINPSDAPYSNITFNRMGGNRLTAYNWVNNASNAGNDYHFESDDNLVSGPAYKDLADVPGGACIPSIEASAAHNAALVLTIPINGYVTAHKLPTPNDVRKIPDSLKTEFRPEQPRKNAPFTLTPDPNSPIVYQDEFVNWVKTKYPYAESDPMHPIWFDLDNEPGIWSQTHAEVHPQRLSYAEFVGKSIDYASASKDVMPGTLIFGPVSYGWNDYVSLQDAPDANGRDFLEFYLDQMAKAEKSAGKRLLDVLDVHYYPEATGNGVRVCFGSNNTPPVAAARVQCTRSFWDPNYTEVSWITRSSTHGPIRLIPRLMEKIAAHYPGTRLAFTEYDCGGGDDITGGIAQADALGIFGVQGVFAAALWPSNEIRYQGIAFEMYRNFDGHNAMFGDTSVRAHTSSIEDSAIYASRDSQNPGRMVIVLINRTEQPKPSSLQLHNAGPFARARAFQFTSAGPEIHPAGAIAIKDGQNLDYTMPARSVSTIELTPAPAGG